MCGRFVVARASSELAAEFNVRVVTDDPAPISYNVAPTTRIPLIVDTVDAQEPDERIRRLEAATWGLVPAWAKDPSVGVRAFNARSETAATKPTFRASVKQHRGVVPADGYFEWQRQPDGTKQPFYLHPQSGDALPLAALYSWWRRGAGDWLLTASILTRAAEGELARIHDRMPVMLAAHDLDEWLEPTIAGDDEFLAEFSERGVAVAEALTLTPVGAAVGNVRNNGPELIQPR